MTAEQLRDARAAAWRQDGHAVLTAEDAAAWLQESGLVLFLPRAAQGSAPAPTFVEATLGRSEATPSPAAIGHAMELVRRLLAAGEIVALNLFGGPGDQPDFLATPETLPFVFAARGDREWERGPRGRSTPLTVEVWKLLDREGALTADEIRDQLGRQLTEAAALRALAELWTGLRVEPVFSEQEGTRWQRLEVSHERAMRSGAAMGQAMALSALVSLYLESVVAATADEIEAFLSPLASRSRVRDAVRGLTATRQLGVRSLIERSRGAQEHFYVEGSLPEFAETGDQQARVPGLLPEVPTPADFVAAGETGDEIAGEIGGGLAIEELPERGDEPARQPGPGRQRFVAQRSQKQEERRSFAPREGARKPFHAREPWKEDAPKKSFSRPRPAGDAGDRPRKSFGSRSDAAPRPFGRRDSAPAERRPYQKRDAGGGDRRPFQRDDNPAGRKPFTRRPEEGERRPFPRRDAGAGERKPWQRREESGGERRPFAPREKNERPRSPRTDTSHGEKPGASERRPFGDKPKFGPKKPFGARKGFENRGEGGTRPPRRGFAPRDENERERPSPRPSLRPGARKGGFGEARPYPRREGAGQNRPDQRREGAREARPYPRRERTEDREATSNRPGGSFGPRTGRPFAKRPASSSDRPPARREGPGGRPFRPRQEEGSPRPFTKRPAGAPRGESSSPRRPGSSGGFAKPAGAAKRFGAGARPSSRPGQSAGTGGKKTRSTPFSSTGKPRPGAAGQRPSRSGPGKGRPSGGAPKKFGGKRPGRDRG